LRRPTVVGVMDPDVRLAPRSGRLRKLGTDIDFRRKQPIPKSLINSDQPTLATGGSTMRNHDFVSDGFLALIATCLVLLCSSLLVIVFG
jgi:hypothetical protein